MRRALAVRKPAHWRLAEAIASVTLAFDERHRRRICLTDDAGEPFLLDLETPALLGHGDGLELEGGGFIAVVAAEEAVLDMICRGPAHAARVAWHIGNRHVPLQVLENGGLRIRDDHVLRRMAEGLGAKVSARWARFAPEGGAYGENDGHDHGN